MCCCRRTAPTANRGFTVLELMIVISLMGLFFAAVQESVIVGLRAVNAADDRETIRQQVTSALDRLTREAVLASNVDQADSGQFQFDMPGTSNVNYAYNSSTLTRTSAGTAQTILQHITSFTLSYIDSSGNTLATPVAAGARNTIRVVQLAVTVNPDTETLSLASAAYLRNM